MAGDDVVGHAMWAWDDADAAPWIGGMVVDARHQRAGIGRATVVTPARHLLRRPDTDVVRLSADTTNAAARRLHSVVGFLDADREEDGEIVLEVTADRLAVS